MTILNAVLVGIVILMAVMLLTGVLGTIVIAYAFKQWFSDENY